MRRRIGFLFVGVGLSFAFSVLYAAGVRGQTPNGSAGVLVETGGAEFMRYCASCHGISATGNGPVAEMLRVRPADLTRIAARRGGNFPAGEIAGFIDGRTEVKEHGTREMPIWGTILGEKIMEGVTEDEVARGRIDALVAYLQSIQK